ncbi:hypothetical protein [Adhaeribacter aquaticus]|uniref:hypothetical protein n=1 Tax=Adhaeribacter aquaticus TaxID=299567 RepID=UPI0003F673C5|nr:hypothetical protein [Adhaeribacter aquaticus]
MKLKKPGSVKAVKKENRSGSKGNILWQHYKELGETSLFSFKALLHVNGIPLTTFYADTYLDKNLGNIPIGRVYVYKYFFPKLDIDTFIKVKNPFIS